MLCRLPADHEFCRHAYVEEPGDVAEEVSRFNLIADPARMPAGTGLWISNVERPKPYHVASHSSYAFTINLGSSFRAALHLSGERTTATVGAGSLLALPPGSDMRVAFSGSDIYRSLTFACDASYLERTAFSAGLPFPSQGLPPSWSPQSDPQTLSLSQAIVAELQSEHCMPMLLETLTLGLSMHVLRRATANAARQPSQAAAGLASHTLRRVTAYMQAHMQETISLDTLASIAGLSTYHFCRMFKQSTGMPPHRYLAQMRIDRAKELLKQTGTPIGDIAFGTGFGSASQFSHFFRKHAGCTPQEYRRCA
jgi:AraC-like DNA-binding protein